MANGSKNLLGPQGQPLHPEAKLVVLKQPRGIQIHPNVLQGIARATGCNVIILPMDCEIMMGKLAMEELNSVHSGIHAVLGIKESGGGAT